MIDVVCVNDTFSQEAREAYAQYNIVTPYLDGIYSVREIVISRKGRGFLLEQLRNPKMPIGEGENGFMVEPNWAVSRFRNLDGTELTEEQLQELLINQKQLV